MLHSLRVITLAWLGLAALVLAAPAIAQPALDPTEQRLAEVHGVVVPRPADRETREQLGFPPPREAREILAEIDAMSAEMRTISARDEVWKQRFREFRAMQRRRISLVSELEESGYEGARLTELLETKLEDIGQIYRSRGWPWASFGAARADMARRYDGTSIGARARAFDMLDRIHGLKHAGLRVHPDDYEKIGDIELQWKEDPDAGLLLLEALHGSDDVPLQRQWHNWILENLPPQTRGYRTVMRRRMFGEPIQLTGDALRGGTIDTADWRGEVILVDFWGMWCAPCIAAMPHLKEMEEKYADRGLRIVGVFVDHEFDRAREFVASRAYDWPQIIWEKSTPENYLEHPIAHKYAVGGFPTLWLIDRDGVLVEQVDRERLEETIVKYLDRE